MGREAIYKGRSVTWDELGVSLIPLGKRRRFPSPGFVSLMPQSDISEHWTAESAPASMWRVANDEIVCEGKPNGFLRSKKIVSKLRAPRRVAVSKRRLAGDSQR